MRASTLVLVLATIAAAPRSAKCTHYMDPLTRVALDADSPWVVTVATADDQVVRLSCEDEGRLHGVYVLHWQVPEAEREESVFVDSKVQAAVASALEAYTEGTAKWSAEASDAPENLWFPVPMGPTGPFRAEATGPRGSSIGWTWRGRTWATAILTVGAPSQNPVAAPTARLISSLRFQLEAGKPKPDVAVVSWNGNWLAKAGQFALPLGDGYSEQQYVHACRGRLSRMSCQYATNGKDEVLVLRANGGDPKALMERVQKELSLPAFTGDSWSAAQNATSVLSFYGSGRLVPALDATGGSGPFLFSLFLVGEVRTMVLIRASEPTVREELRARLRNVSYDQASSYLAFAYWLGALMAWLGAAAVVQLLRKRKTLGMNSTPLVVVCGVLSALCLVAHLVASPPLPGSWFSVTIALFLPVVLVAVAAVIALLSFVED